MKAGKRRLPDKAGAQAAARHKASVRAKAEHPFLYVKRRFGDAKGATGAGEEHPAHTVLLGFSNLLVAGRCAVA